MRCVGADWTQLAQVKVKWRTLVNTALNFQYLWKSEFLDQLSDYQSLRELCIISQIYNKKTVIIQNVHDHQKTEHDDRVVTTIAHPTFESWSEDHPLPSRKRTLV
jgi:hypothetical protein